MLDEFIFVAKSVRVQDTILVHDDCVIKAASASQTCGAQRFDLAHETKGASPRHRLDVRISGEVDFGKISRGINGRMTEIDGK